MASKKKNKATTNTANLPALRIGSRVRCTDDGVEGRIVWANGVSVKIKWDDGEQVTWRRDALASKPIEIIDPDADEQPATAETSTDQTTVPTAVEPTAAHVEAAEEQPATTPDVPPADPASPPAPEAIPEASQALAEPAPTDA